MTFPRTVCQHTTHGADQRKEDRGPQGITEAEIRDLIESNAGIAAPGGRLGVVNADIAATAIYRRIAPRAGTLTFEDGIKAAAKLVQGEQCFEHYRHWPTIWPIGNVSNSSEIARRCDALATAILALSHKEPTK